MAGKAHPHDTQAKELIREIVHYARMPETRNRVIFLEDYDINVARYMLQGVDCWLNTPRRPMEASGTSGMKVALNGIPNLSVLDGWWAEGYNGANGWAIAPSEEYANRAAQDAADARALYELLENEVVPLYYERDPDDVPRAWVRVMKEAIRTAAPAFCTRRMVKEYTEKFYVPLARRTEEME
jgi:starch phosphorylase